MTDNLDPKDHFSPRQCDGMRDQFSRRDETDNITRAILRIHGHQIGEILVRLRALDGQDHEAADGL